MGDARHPNEKMHDAMGILMNRDLPPRKAVSSALLQFIRALSFIDRARPMPKWAEERVDAVFAIVPRDGEERERWILESSMEQLNAVCDALLSFYAATAYENGRQSR